jgi:hypothetical protein
MTEPLTHARIGYDSITERATISASAALTGFPASAAANQLTYSFWSAALPATWQAVLDDAEVCNYFGIAAHTLWSNNAMAVMQAWIDSINRPGVPAWTTLPVLTTVGDVWRFDGDFYGMRGAAPGATIGSLRRGIAADGGPIRPYAGSAYTGEQESKFGDWALTVEPNTTNLFPANVRDCGDTSGDLTGFNGASTAAYSTDRAVSGAGSMLVTLAGVRLLQTDPVAVDASSDYSASFKFQGRDGAIDVTVKLYGDVSGLLGTTIFTAVPPGSWVWLQATETTGVGDTTLYITIELDDESGYVDELQLEKQSLATTWADDARTGADPAYPPEILQQSAGDMTINLWARSPSASASAAGYIEAADATPDNYLYLFKAAGSNLISFVTKGNGNVDSLPGSAAFAGDWHMITVVVQPDVSGEDNKFIYVDGKLSNSVETTYLPDWSVITNFKVGHVLGLGTGDDGASLMDDLTILNRAATATEIKAWYESGEKMDLATAGLASYEDDRPIMQLVEETRANKFRIKVVGQTTPVLGVIYMGKALEMPRALYAGHTPIGLARDTVTRPNISERGQFLGRSIIRSGSRGSWAWDNLTPAWVRRYLDPFIVSARTFPFFIWWRPSTKPGEVGYCWTQQDLSATNNGTQALMSFSLEAEGLGNE